LEAQGVGFSATCGCLVDALAVGGAKFVCKPQMTISDGKIVTPVKPKISRVEVYWHTVTYKTVALYVLLILGIASSLTYFVFPEASSAIAKKLSDTKAPTIR
jgi:hypothetical protein